MSKLDLPVEVTLGDCVLEAFSNREFMRQYRRLTKTDFGLSSGVAFEIDLATGHYEAQALAFIAFVHETIFSRLPA